jgi:hypothetical protein
MYQASPAEAEKKPTRAFRAILMLLSLLSLEKLEKEFFLLVK